MRSGKLDARQSLLDDPDRAAESVGRRTLTDVEPDPSCNLRYAPACIELMGLVIALKRFWDISNHFNIECQVEIGGEPQGYQGAESIYKLFSALRVARTAHQTCKSLF